MPANSEKAKATLEGALAELFPEASQHICAVAGGFVVGLVGHAFSTLENQREKALEVLKAMGPVNHRIKDPQDRVVIFDVKFFVAEGDVFCTDAILRDRASDIQRGTRTSYATVGTAYVKAHAIDAEAMSIDPEVQVTCRVVLDPAFPKDPARLNSTQYVQFDLLGLEMDVDRIEKTDGDIWVIHVK